MITTQHIEEGLSLAYVHAISAQAGLNVSVKERRHDYGIDGTFHEVSRVNGKIKESGYSLDFQLKASVNCRGTDNDISYDLDATTYNYLIGRHGRGTPVILLVLNLPTEPNKWIDISHEHLLIRHSCYWYSFGSSSLTTNSSSRAITMPRANLLSPSTLKKLMEKIKSGELR